MYLYEVEFEIFSTRGFKVEPSKLCDIKITVLTKSGLDAAKKIGLAEVVKRREFESFSKWDIIYFRKITLLDVMFATDYNLG